MPDQKKVVLIVDDEPDICEILSLTFESKGFATLTANSGNEGIKIVNSQHVDIVISDIQMPNGNGVSLLESVKTKDCIIPMVLFITGFTDITIEEAYDKGAEAIFAKPFDNMLLVQTVEKLITEATTNVPCRRNVREKTSLQLEVKFQEYADIQNTTMLNIGRGGLFTSIEKYVPKIGETVSFKLKVEETLIEGSGVVKWVRPEERDGKSPGCGIEFQSFEGNSRTRIYEYINFLKTRQYIPQS